MTESDFEETKAVALLPNLKIEIIHARSLAGDAERLSIDLIAFPSFAAVGRYFEATNPFLFWMRVMQTAWGIGGGQKKAAITDQKSGEGGQFTGFP